MKNASQDNKKTSCELLCITKILFEQSYREFCFLGGGGGRELMS
jgi:hypothetical protein